MFNSKIVLRSSTDLTFHPVAVFDVVMLPFRIGFLRPTVCELEKHCWTWLTCVGLCHMCLQDCPTYDAMTPDCAVYVPARAAGAWTWRTGRCLRRLWWSCSTTRRGRRCCGRSTRSSTDLPLTSSRRSFSSTTTPTGCSSRWVLLLEAVPKDGHSSNRLFLRVGTVPTGCSLTGAQHLQAVSQGWHSCYRLFLKGGTAPTGCSSKWVQLQQTVLQVGTAPAGCTSRWAQVLRRLFLSVPTLKNSPWTWKTMPECIVWTCTLF